jgi:hypothetical protein
MSLLELEGALGRTDAVMEPRVERTLREYVAAGGRPESAVQLLKEGYRGAWIAARGDSRGLGHAPFALFPRCVTLAVPYAGYAQMTLLVCGWLEETAEAAPPAAGGAQGAGPASSRDEYAFAEAVLRDRFDPAAVDEATKAQMGQAMPWFTALMETPRGRSLLYALAEQHRTCSTLGLAISLAWQKGYEDEVAGLGPAVASSFDIFHGVLRRQLDRILSAGEGAARDSAVAELRRLCASSPATYLFTQMLLASAAGGAGGAPLRRVAQELEAGLPGAATQQSDLLRRMVPLLARSAADTAAVAAAGRLVAAAQTPPLTAMLDAEAAALWRVYAPSAEAAEREAASAMDVDADGGSVPPAEAAPPAQAGPGLEALRVPAVVQALLREAFAAVARGGSGGASAESSASVRLLALACSAPDERAATRAALASAARMVAAAAQGATPDGDALSVIVATPVAAAGLAAAVARDLGDAEFYRRVHAPTALVSYIGMLSACAAQAGTHAHIADGLAAAMRTLGRAAMERSEQLLQLVPVLLRAGCVAPLLAMGERWVAGDFEPSLVRTFVALVLSVAAPPYSPQFAAAVLRLCDASGVGRGASPAADEFAAEVARAHARYQPPLGDAERRALDALLR